MDLRLLGLAAIALGLYTMWNRHHDTDEQIRQQNRIFSILRLRRRYGEREYRQSVRARVILGVVFIVFGSYWLMTG